MVWWNEDLARLKVERNKAQNEASRSKGETEAEQERLRKAAAAKKEEFAKAQMTAQRESWQNFVSTLDARSEAAKLFGVIRAMDGRMPKAKSSAAIRGPTGKLATSLYHLIKQ